MDWQTHPLEAEYQIFLLNHHRLPVRVIDSYFSLDYTKAINGERHHGWGTFSLTSTSEFMPASDLHLDYIISVRRKVPGSTNYDVDFEGLIRKISIGQAEGDFLQITIEGFDLKSFLKRRVVIPDTDTTMITLEDHWTDMMRELVRLQCTAAGPVARLLPGLVVEADTHEGTSFQTSFRWTLLADEMELLSGLGADFDIVRDPVSNLMYFRVYYLHSGSLDSRIDNPDGNPPVEFSLYRRNLTSPQFLLDRSTEITSVYVLGDGPGAQRTVVNTQSLDDSMYDSPWNVIESIIDDGNEASLLKLYADGDSMLLDNAKKRIFTFASVARSDCLYGREWSCGDFVSARFYNELGMEELFSMRVVETSVHVDRSGEIVAPTLVQWDPTLEELYEPY